jgi:CRISPR system Cascade subunit CasE
MTASETKPLYLVHMTVALPELARFAHDRNRGALRRRRHSDGRETESGIDEGRALHHVLDETFGPGALRPFRLLVAPGKAGGSVYAYSRSSKAALLATARETSLPEAQRVLGLEALADREMPLAWSAGRRLAFDIRIRPVVRLRTPLPDPRQPDNPYKIGAELDAFFVEAQRLHPDARPRIVDGKLLASGMTQAERTREKVYCDWLSARITGAADLDVEKTSMPQFRRTRVSRSGPAPEGPDAILHGELTITDPSAFARLLANGVGRHKAYGFGMLMLRPASRVRLED